MSIFKTLVFSNILLLSISAFSLPTKIRVGYTYRELDIPEDFKVHGAVEHVTWSKTYVIGKDGKILIYKEDSKSWKFENSISLDTAFLLDGQINDMVIYGRYTIITKSYVRNLRIIHAGFLIDNDSGKIVGSLTFPRKAKINAWGNGAEFAVEGDQLGKENFHGLNFLYHVEFPEYGPLINYSYRQFKSSLLDRTLMRIGLSCAAFFGVDNP